MDLIEQHRAELKKLCENFFVQELYAFGSVVSNNYTKDSDIDFLVNFSGVELVDYFDNYMDFKDALARMFKREIDLVEIQTLKNPVLIQSIERSKILVYGREGSKVAV